MNDQPKKRSHVETAIFDIAATGEPFTAGDVARLTGVTRQAAHYHLRRLVNDGLLVLTGTGRGARYRPVFSFHQAYPLTGLAEDEVWHDVAASTIANAPESSRRLLSYAVTEMVNNAIDHSGGTRVVVSAGVSEGRCAVEVVDDGVGVFRHLRESLGLPDDLAALNELQKGKRTTMPERHTGEGIFFTSKAVDRFELESGELRWIVDNEIPDMAIGVGSGRHGTRVRLEHRLASPRSLSEVFDEYATTEFEFDRTRLTIRLVASGNSFVSRSQAKRITDGLDRFREVEVDFSGVDEIGQGFADELFRVWQRDHLGTRLVPLNMNRPVQFMVDRARGSGNVDPGAS